MIARAEGLHGEEYAVAQNYKGFFGDLYSVNFYYRPGQEGPWTAYWLAYDDPYWRAQILVDRGSDQITIEEGGEAVAVFDRDSERFQHRIHPDPSMPFQGNVDNPQTCPAD